MLTTSDVTRVYDTILSIPGMNEVVKIDLKISRKNVLFLNSIIKKGLASKGDKHPGLLSCLLGENLEELKALADGCLQKAGLIELNEKLNALDDDK